MTLQMHWFLPTTGDSRYVVGGGHGSTPGVAAGDRPASVEYLAQIARSAEQLGFTGALTPTGAWCEDAWVVTAMLTQLTERLKFLVAFRPGLVSPVLAAQMAATYQRQSHGRLLLNVVTGGDGTELDRPFPTTAPISTSSTRRSTGFRTPRHKSTSAVPPQPREPWPHVTAMCI